MRKKPACIRCSSVIGCVAIGIAGYVWQQNKDKKMAAMQGGYRGSPYGGGWQSPCMLDILAIRLQMFGFLIFCLVRTIRMLEGIPCGAQFLLEVLTPQKEILGTNWSSNVIAGMPSCSRRCWRDGSACLLVEVGRPFARLVESCFFLKLLYIMLWNQLFENLYFSFW